MVTPAITEITEAHEAAPLVAPLPVATDFGSASPAVDDPDRPKRRQK